MTVLELALCNLKDDLMLSGYFNRIYPYAEQIERGNEKFPQVYIGNGEYQMIYDLDVNGVGYFRKTGQVRFNDVSTTAPFACYGDNPLKDMVVPLRFVAAVPKSMLGDSGLSDDLLAMELVGYLGSKQTAIVNISSIQGYVDSYQTDRDRVFSEEVQGINRQIDLALSFIAIDFTLVFRANLDCLRQDCTY